MNETSESLRRLLDLLTDGSSRSLTITWDEGSPDSPISDGHSSVIEIQSNGFIPIARLVGVPNGLDNLLEALGLTRQDFTAQRVNMTGPPTFHIVRLADNYHLERID